MSACLFSSNKEYLCVRCCANEYQIILTFPLHLQSDEDLSVVPLCSALWSQLKRRGQYRKREGERNMTSQEMTTACVWWMVPDTVWLRHSYPRMCGAELWLRLSWRLNTRVYVLICISRSLQSRDRTCVLRGDRVNINVNVELCESFRKVRSMCRNFAFAAETRAKFT